MKLLVTGAGGSGAEALFRLWSANYDVHFADADVKGISPSIPSQRCHQIPMAGPQWPEAIANLCQALSIDVLISCVDEELPLVPHVVRAVPHVLPLLPSPEFVRVMKDKLESMTSLSAKGVNTPRSVPLSDVEAIGFPCFVKPRDGRGSRGIQIVKTPEQLKAYLVLSERAPESILAQELLSGQEWTVYVAADRQARLRSVVPIRVDLKRGITIKAETVAHAGIIAYCQKLHAQFPTPGPYNVQLMETPSGRLAAFEINPRVSTTLCLAVAAGADPIADFLRTDADAGLRPFKAGVKLQRNWHNFIR